MGGTMGKTIQQNDSASQFFLDSLHQAGVENRDIDGAIADDAVGGPSVGQCREPSAANKDGKVSKSEVFAVAFNNLVKHGDTVKRYFQKLGLKEVEHLQSDGQFATAFRTQLQRELLGADPQRSLKSWPNPKKLQSKDPQYASELLTWASRHTRLSLLPYKEQVEVLKQLGLEESQVKGPLGKLWQGMTVPKMISHASMLRGEELLREARERRGLGDAGSAQELEKQAHKLFQTAVELDGKNPAARLRLAQALEGQGYHRQAGLHYA